MLGKCVEADRAGLGAGGYWGAAGASRSRFRGRAVGFVVWDLGFRV